MDEERESGLDETREAIEPTDETIMLGGGADEEPSPPAAGDDDFAWQQEAPAGEGQTPQPAQAAAPGPAPGSRKKTCCACCLGIALVPLTVAAAVLIWVSVGAAPAPADCLPPDAPVSVVVREPIDLLGRVNADERWRSLLEVPEENMGRWALFLAGQLLGSEAALALELEQVPVDPGKGGTRAEERLVFASRPSIWARGLERLLRGSLEGNDEVSYGMIGKTLVFSDDGKRVDAVLARREEILNPKESSSPPRETAVEIRFRNLRPSEFGATADGADVPLFLFDLPTVEGLSGFLRLDRDLSGVTGRLTFPAGKLGAPPALGLMPPRSARLVPQEALAYWVWHAPQGKGLWSSGGRMERWLGVFDAELGELFGLNLEPGRAEDVRKHLGFDPGKLVAERLTGERALSVVAQQRSGGKPLLAAATLMVECRDTETAWPQIVKLLSAFYPKSEDGRPPKEGELDVYPHFVERRYRDWPYLELVYAHYPWGSGYRPAVGVVGGFVVATTSRAELERTIDRAAKATGRSLAGDPFLAAPAGGARPSAAALVRPQGRGQELADLVLAIAQGTSDQGADEEARENAAEFGRFLSQIEFLRAAWKAAADGSLTIEIEGKIAPPAR
ncbi:MAG: hypothetical protein ACYTGB_03870 [Planctomycetota bacterium]